MRSGVLRYWLTGICLLGLVSAYVAPAVNALRFPAYVAPLPALRVAGVWFPPLTIPKLHAPPAIPRIARQKPTAGQPGHRVVRRRIPAVTDSYSAVPAGLQQQAPAEPFAASPVVSAMASVLGNAPVVTDTVNTPVGGVASAPAIDPGLAAAGSAPTATIPASTQDPGVVVDSIGGPQGDPAATAAAAAQSSGISVDSIGGPPVTLPGPTVPSKTAPATAPAATSPDAADPAATTPDQTAPDAADPAAPTPDASSESPSIDITYPVTTTPTTTTPTPTPTTTTPATTTATEVVYTTHHTAVRSLLSATHVGPAAPHSAVRSLLSATDETPPPAGDGTAASDPSIPDNSEPAGSTAEVAPDQPAIASDATAEPIQSIPDAQTASSTDAGGVVSEAPSTALDEGAGAASVASGEPGADPASTSAPAASVVTSTPAADSSPPVVSPPVVSAPVVSAPVVSAPTLEIVVSVPSPAAPGSDTSALASLNLTTPPPGDSPTLDPATSASGAQVGAQSPDSLAGLPASVTAGAPTPPTSPGAASDSGAAALPSPDSVALSSPELAPLNPAAVPGSGRGPPSPWLVSATSGTVTIAVDGTDLVVTSGGVSTYRPQADVGSLSISSPGGLVVDLSGGAISMPVSYDGGGSGSISVISGTGSAWQWDGGAGQVSGGGIISLAFTGVTKLAAGGPGDTLFGPAADSTWTVTGAGSGTVGGLSFSGFEQLVGAADNRDQFVFEPGGSISGGIDGGPGGFDTLVVDGGAYQAVTYTTTGPNSGSVSRDGNVIEYAGLEPIDDTTAGPDRSFSNGVGGVTITIADSGAPGDGAFTITPSTGESVRFTDAANIKTLTINAGTGDQTIRYSSIDSTVHRLDRRARRRGQRHLSGIGRRRDMASHRPRPGHLHGDRRPDHHVRRGREPPRRVGNRQLHLRRRSAE